MCEFSHLSFCLGHFTRLSDDCVKPTIILIHVIHYCMEIHLAWVATHASMFAIATQALYIALSLAHSAPIY